MVNYHLNDDGDAIECILDLDNCSYGGPSQHYGSTFDAEAGRQFTLSSNPLAAASDNHARARAIQEWSEKQSDAIKRADELTDALNSYLLGPAPMGSSIRSISHRRAEARGDVEGAKLVLDAIYQTRLVHYAAEELKKNAPAPPSNADGDSLRVTWEAKMNAIGSFLADFVPTQANLEWIKERCLTLAPKR